MRQEQRLQELLTEKRLKKTAQRTRVWEAILEADEHLSVEDIRERLLERGHRVGLSTIYRTLKILLESGMVRQVRFGSTTQYEALVSQPNHIHFVCNLCGKTEEFSSRRIEKLIREETAKHDFQPVYSRYAIFGLCRECARNETSETGLGESGRQAKILARDALELTLAVERRGYSFYRNASEKTKDPAGRLMFRQLAEEESEHMDRLGREYRALMDEHRWLRREPARLPVTRKIADQIFPERELLKLEVDEGTTHLDALGIAIDLERRSHRYFTSFARQLDDPRGRKIFREFAREERSHLDSLLEEYEKLKKEMK